ncbi:cation:proton antiporter [Caloramator sp. E03]|uniref:monovalent cation/H+ antiporter complex subunit F n=1 Tax=Caloramator sp. E03 TaxID=2576307 RepID=UPI001110F63C|nr:cation:proton antiporter [Caloramator sp. E03]
MIELIIIGILYIFLSFLLLYRVAKGPNVVDRVIAVNSIEIMTSVALILFSLYSGRGIYLDIALIITVIGFIKTVLISRYLEGKL